MKTVAAFANGQGGRILLGVEDKNRRVDGIPDDKVSSTEEWVVNISQNNVHPPVKIDTRLLQLPDTAGVLKTVIYIEIPRSIFVHSSAGRYYQRIGSSKREMKPEALARLFQQRSQSRLIRFDETAVPQTGSSDIDPTLKQRFLKANTPAHQQLRKLHLTATEENEERLSVSGVLLLTGQPTQWLSNAYIQCVFYAGTERDAHQQLDASDYDGPLDRQIDDAFEWALAKDPEDRPESVVQWVDSFIDVLEQMPDHDGGWLAEGGRLKDPSTIESRTEIRCD